MRSRISFQVVADAFRGLARRAVDWEAAGQ